MEQSTGQPSEVEIQKIIFALVEAESEKEKDDQVRSQLATSIYAIGTRHHTQTLHALLLFYRQPACTKLQKMLILTSINAIIDHEKVLSNMDQELSIQVIQVAVDGVLDKEMVEIGSDVLVTLSRSHCIEVMKQMLNLFQPGHLPAPTTFQTFGRIFSTNVNDSIPFLSAVLSMLVPLLGEAKSDALKRAIAGAVSQFGEAILEYVANESDNPEPSAKVSFFQHDFNAVFEHILLHWMPKIRDAEQAAYMIHALSCLAKVVSKDKLQELADKLLGSAINTARRYPHESSASEGLAIVLEIAASNAKSTLEPQLDQLIDVIFAQACLPPDYAKPFAVKSHNEVLRCFTILYLNFPDRIIQFLLGKLSPNVLKSAVSKDANDRSVVGALTIINKLVNQQDISFSFYLVPLIKSLEPVVSPSPTILLSNNVKQSVAQLILTLADRLYLTEENSGQLMEFIIRQCSLPASTIPRSPSGLDSVTDESLRASCENVLHLLTTTVHGMEKILLPSLFDYLVMGPYTESVRTVSKCLVHLNTKQDIFATLMSANERRRSPSLVELFTRLVVLAGFVWEKPDGDALLSLLQLVSGHMSPVMTELWQGTLEELGKFLTRSMDAPGLQWDSKAWEDSLIKLLQTTLRDLKTVEPDLVHRIAESLAVQISLYTDAANEKAFLYLCLGCTLEVSSDPLVVNKALDRIFSSVNHSKIVERQACGIALGRACSAHFELMLSKLDAFALADKPGHKRSSFLNILFSKDKVESVDSERAKATVVLCYGYAVAGAPKALLLARVDDILRSVMPFFVGVKDFSIKHSLCRFVEMLAKAMKETNSALDKRPNLLFHMKEFIKSEPSELRSSVRALAMTAAAELALLPPKMPVEEMEDALVLFSNSVFPLLPPRHDQVTNVPLEVANTAYLNYEVLWEATFKALSEFMVTVLKVHRSSEAMLTVIKNLKPWLESDSDHERHHALQMLNNVLASDVVTENVVASVLGSTAGIIATKAMDPDVRCREMALSCTKLLSAIVSGGKNGSDAPSMDIREASYTKDKLSSYALAVSSFYNQMLEDDQLTKFVRQLYYQGLLEKRAVTATGVGALLQSTVKNKWPVLKEHGPEIVAGLLYALKYVKDPSTKVAVEGCLHTIAQHDTDLVARILLNQPVPLHQSTSDLWRSLGSVPSLATVLLLHCVEVIRTTPPYSEIHAHARIVNLPILQSLSVLSELFQSTDNTELLQAHFAELASILLVMTGSMVGAQSTRPPQAASTTEQTAVDSEWKQVYKLQPVKVAIGTLKQLLKSTNCVVPISFEMMEDTALYAEGLYVTAKCIFQSSDINTRKVVENMTAYLNSDFEAQRAAAVATFSAMLESKKPEKPAAVTEIIGHLTAKNADQSAIVRIFCIRGVGSLVNFGPEIVNIHADSIIKIILSGLEDTSSSEVLVNVAPVEAMKALNRILPVIEHSRIQDDLMSFAMRLRPFFESSNPVIRATAFALFGSLAAVTEKQSVKEAFTQEIHNVLVILLLHLNDENSDVSSTTRAIFKLLLPLLKSESLNNAFSYPEGVAYGRLLRIICSSLGSDYAEKIPMFLNLVIGYFRSESPTMRANAALLAGNLLAQASTSPNPDTIPSHVSPAVIHLLGDKEAVVRLRAAEALGLMYQKNSY